MFFLWRDHFLGPEINNPPTVGGSSAFCFVFFVLFFFEVHVYLLQPDTVIKPPENQHSGQSLLVSGGTVHATLLGGRHVFVFCRACGSAEALSVRRRLWKKFSRCLSRTSQKKRPYRVEESCLAKGLSSVSPFYCFLFCLFVTVRFFFVALVKPRF